MFITQDYAFTQPAPWTTLGLIFLPCLSKPAWFVLPPTALPMMVLLKLKGRVEVYVQCVPVTSYYCLLTALSVLLCVSLFLYLSLFVCICHTDSLFLHLSVTHFLPVCSVSMSVALSFTVIYSHSCSVSFSNFFIYPTLLLSLVTFYGSDVSSSPSQLKLMLILIITHAQTWSKARYGKSSCCVVRYEHELILFYLLWAFSDADINRQWKTDKEKKEKKRKWEISDNTAYLIIVSSCTHVINVSCSMSIISLQSIQWKKLRLANPTGIVGYLMGSVKAYASATILLLFCSHTGSDLANPCSEFQFTHSQSRSGSWRVIISISVFH